MKMQNTSYRTTMYKINYSICLLHVESNLFTACNTFVLYHSIGAEAGKYSHMKYLQSTCWFISTWAESAFHICRPLCRRIIEIIWRTRAWNQNGDEQQKQNRSRNEKRHVGCFKFGVMTFTCLRMWTKLFWIAEGCLKFQTRLHQRLFLASQLHWRTLLHPRQLFLLAPAAESWGHIYSNLDNFAKTMCSKMFNK